MRVATLWLVSPRLEVDQSLSNSLLDGSLSDSFLWRHADCCIVSLDCGVLVTSSHRCLSTVSFSISLPAHCLHTHHTYYTGTWQGTWEDFYDIYGIGKYEAWLFFFLVFSLVVRNPADSDRRPTAGAQVLVRVSMIPRHPYHSEPALHCKVPRRAESCSSPKATGTFFVAAECDSCDLAFRGVVVLSCLRSASILCIPSDGSSPRCSVVSGIEVSILRYLIQVLFDHFLQACAAERFFFCSVS